MRRVVQCGGPPKESLNKSSAERVAATHMGRGFTGHLLCQAPSEGDQPFAHLILQSHRRAYEGFVQGLPKSCFYSLFLFLL